ncbi:MAG: hypothetical protein GF341_08460 [candidate division Zixibacteria bacterium]|nr:hypothetical protein [candidate division Zixibacteria bacterium]
MDSTHGKHILKQTWPVFLDLLDSDRETAANEFAAFALAVLKVHPPRVYQSITPEQREDYSQEIVMHFLNEDAAVLRQYRNRSLPFASWFSVVAMRKAYDIFRRDQRRQSTESSYEDAQEYRSHSNPGASADERYGYREVLAKVVTCLKQMSNKCQVLLQAAAEGYEPKELVALMPAELRDNKHASDSLRACRKRLRALLSDNGVDPSQYVGKHVKE